MVFRKILRYLKLVSAIFFYLTIDSPYEKSFLFHLKSPFHFHFVVETLPTDIVLDKEHLYEKTMQKIFTKS